MTFRLAELNLTQWRDNNGVFMMNDGDDGDVCGIW